MLEAFEDLGVDAITGTEIMSYAGVSPDEIQDPVRFERLRDIIDYVKKLPDRRYFVSKVTAGRDGERLDHLWGYVELHKQRESKLSEIKKLEEEISYYTR